MPEFFLPVSFGKITLKNHLISTWIFDPDKKNLISGAMNGEIILWDSYFKPYMHLSPHLLWSVGSVTALHVVKRPFSEFQESNRRTCLLSIHQDKRVRLWNMDDGKTFLTSDHDQFQYTSVITQVITIGERDSRYVMCSGIGSNTMYIYDLWKMCCSRIFQIHEHFDPPVFTAVHCVSKQEVGAISSRGMIYKIDTRALGRPEKQEYLLYMDYKRTKNIIKQNKQKLTIRMTSEFSLMGLPSKKVINSVYDQNQKILTLVYSKQVAFVKGAYKEQERQKETIIMSCATSVKKFKNVQQIFIDKQGIYMFQFCDGNKCFIFMKDIERLLDVITESRLANINFSFGAFSFTKLTSKPIGYLTLNLVPQIIGQPVEYFNQQDSIIITQNGKTNLILYNENQFMMYNLDQLLELYPKISICKSLEDQSKFWDAVLESEGSKIEICSQSVYIALEGNKQTLLKHNEIIKLDQQLMNIVPNNPIIDEILREEQISNSLLFVIQKQYLIYFVGTVTGKILGFPFFYSQDEGYKIYSAQCSQYPIQQLVFNKDTLFVQDSKNLLFVFDLRTYEVESQSKQPHQISTHNPIFTQMVQGQVVQVLKIRCLNPTHQTSQGPQPLFNPSEMFNIRNKFIRGLIALQLDDGSVFIYNPTGFTQKYFFPNVVSPQERVLNFRKMNIYFHPLLMHYIVIHGKHASMWHERTGSLDRIVGLDAVIPLFNLQQITEQAFSPLLEYNDFRQFQGINSSSSLYLDLLEFSYKSFTYQINYRNELSTKVHGTQLNYESLALILKLKEQSLELSEILNLLHHDSENVVYKDRRAGIVIFQQNNRQLEEAFELHQIYQKGKDVELRKMNYKLQLPFHRINKFYQKQNVESIQEKYFTIWFDCKRNIGHTHDMIEQKKSKKNKILIKNLSLRILIDCKFFAFPISEFCSFSCYFGQQGTGESISRSLNYNAWRLSGAMCAQYSLTILFYLKNITQNDDPMGWAMKILTNKLLENPDKIMPSFPILSRFCLDQDYEVINASCALIHYNIQYAQTKGVNAMMQLKTLQRSSKEFLLYFQIHRSEKSILSEESLCIVIQVYLSLSSLHGSNDDIIQYELSLFIILYEIRPINCFTQSTCLILYCKMISEGISVFKQFFRSIQGGQRQHDYSDSSNIKLLQDPRFIMTSQIRETYHFLHITSKQQYQLYLNEYFETHKLKKPKDREKEKYKIQQIEQFFTLTPILRQNIKSSVKNLITTMAMNYEDIFIDICNDLLDLHDSFFLIACSILDLLKALSKAIPSNKFDDILALKIVQIAVRTQDQYHPTPTRLCYQSMINLLNRVCQRCNFVALSRPGQKLAIALRGSVVLFDLRFGMKFAQIDRYQSDVTCIAFDYNALNFASFSLRDKTIYTFSVKQTDSLMETMETQCVKVIKSINVLEDIDVQKIPKEHFTIKWDEQTSNTLYLDWKIDQMTFQVI